MKTSYPVVISKGEKYLIATVPDCEIDTQGENIGDAIKMARDAISLWCVCKIDGGHSLPKPSEISEISHAVDDIVTLVDVDIDAYRHEIAGVQVMDVV